MITAKISEVSNAWMSNYMWAMQGAMTMMNGVSSGGWREGGAWLCGASDDEGAHGMMQTSMQMMVYQLPAAMAN